MVGTESFRIKISLVVLHLPCGVILLLFVLKTLSSGIISEDSTIEACHQFNKCHADIDNVWVSVEI